MEIKKMPQADLRKQRAMYLSLGLMLSFAFSLTAFEWKSYGDDPMDLGELVMEAKENEIIVITYHKPKPPKPPTVPREIIAVPDETELDPADDIVLDPDEMVLEEPIIEPEPDEKAEEIHQIVEEMPSPVGGLSAFNQYISKNIKYPRLAQRMRIEGKVFVSFIIARDGSLTDIQLLKGIGGGCDEEALRVIKAAPKWNPGKQRGVPVKVRMSLPITFTLN